MPVCKICGIEASGARAAAVGLRFPRLQRDASRLRFTFNQRGGVWEWSWGFVYPQSCQISRASSSAGSCRQEVYDKIITQWNWVKWFPRGWRVLSGWLPELTCLPHQSSLGHLGPAANAHRWCYLSQSLSIIHSLIERTALNERLKNKTASKNQPCGDFLLSVTSELLRLILAVSSPKCHYPWKISFQRSNWREKKTCGSISGWWSRIT